MVWIAGPLSGLVMQPLVGAVTDNSRSRWGRRRPFMIGGSILVVMCLLVLGWTKEVVGFFVSDPAKVCEMRRAGMGVLMGDYSRVHGRSCLRC